MRRRALLMLLISGAAFSGSACAPVDGLRHDHVFGVTGVVTAEDGTPLVGADVSLEVTSPVYSAVDPITTQQRVTNDTGGFVFMYNAAHQRPVTYSLTISKAGFEAQTLTGSAPPAEHHTIRLTRR